VRQDFLLVAYADDQRMQRHGTLPALANTIPEIGGSACGGAVGLHRQHEWITGPSRSVRTLGLDRSELGAVLVPAALCDLRDGVLLTYSRCNGLPVPEALDDHIDDCGARRRRWSSPRVLDR